jgi:putative membrane protein
MFIHGDNLRILSFIIWLIVILLGLTFATLNAEPVTLNYYFGSRTISLSLLLVLCFGIGVIIGLLIALSKVLRLKMTNYQLKKQIALTQKE